MQFIDTHIHLQDDKSNNATDIIHQATEQGCARMICVSSQEKDWAQVALLAEQFSDKVVPAFGIHPWYVSEVAEGWSERLEEMLQRFPQALIGECGLDGMKPEPEKQKQIFLKQLEIASQYQRQMIIHAVKAVPLMQEYWQSLPPKFVIHGFNAKAEFLKQIIQADGYIGIGGSLLKTQKAKDILALIPADKMLFETDAPFQAKAPWQILQYLSDAAALLGVDKNKLAEQVYHNSMEFMK